MQQLPTLKTFTIFQGDSEPMGMKAIYQNSLDPYDLTDCTEVVVSLPKSDGGILELKLTEEQVEIVLPKVLGKIIATIDEESSALLRVGEYQNVDVTYTIAGKENTVRYERALTVLQRQTAS
jgi:hypothetical protein